MPSVFKYNTNWNAANATVASPYSMRKGQFTIGMNSVNYGPTSSTGYYAGLDPWANGYILYYTNGAGSPTCTVFQTDQALINEANRLGAGISTIGGALNYFRGQAAYLVIDCPFEDIVTNSQIANNPSGGGDRMGLALEPGYGVSYPRTGSTVYDLIGASGGSGTLFSATLTNSPTFTQVANTYWFSYNGTDQYATTPGGMTNPTTVNKLSICVWAGTSSTSTTIKPVVSKTSGNSAQYYPGVELGFCYSADGSSGSPGKFYAYIRATDGLIYGVETQSSYNNGAPHYFVLTWGGSADPQFKLYVDGVQASTTDIGQGVSAIPSNSTFGAGVGYSIGRRLYPSIIYSPISVGGLHGGMGPAISAELSADEVKRNYNAQCVRYGLSQI